MSVIQSMPSSLETRPAFGRATRHFTAAGRRARALLILQLLQDCIIRGLQLEKPRLGIIEGMAGDFLCLRTFPPIQLELLVRQQRPGQVWKKE